jgi:hypothetical protein
MKQKLNSVFLFILLVSISAVSKAQLKLKPEYFSSNKKTELFPKSFRLKNFGFDSAFSYNLKVLGPNKIALPLDNMTCLLPPEEIRYHIQIFNPHSAGDNYIYNMPNALPKADLVK